MARDIGSDIWARGPIGEAPGVPSFVVVTTYLTERELREERVTLVYSSREYSLQQGTGQESAAGRDVASKL